MEHPGEHLEHVEHQEHASHNPFDRKVAMSMAILAALLAAVTLLSHKSHNETLRLQTEAAILGTEAGILQTEANVKHTEATDQWGFYQAKNIRQHQYDSLLALSAFVAKDPSQEEALKKAQTYWKNQVDKYKDTDLPKIKSDAERLTREAQDKEKASIAKAQDSKKSESDSHLVHQRANWFDLGELGLQLSLILCSIAVLTKRAPFWYGGLVAGLAGVVAAGLGFLVQPH